MTLLGRIYRRVVLEAKLKILALKVWNLRLRRRYLLWKAKRLDQKVTVRESREFQHDQDQEDNS